jgi:signal peptidase I
LRKLPFVAAIAAFLLAAIALLAAFQHPVLALFALVPLAAGIGILRKRIWSAYGFALFELAQLAVMLLTSRAGAMTTSQLVFTIALNVVLAFLFFMAGRSLAASGGARGLVLPWIAVCCLFTLPLFFVRAFVIPSGGMEDTLLIGDRMLTRVFPHVRPKRGDIVVFHYPLDRHQVFVKRVIGLPGDRIRVTSGTVYRNGSPLDEPYAIHKFVSPGIHLEDFPGHSPPPGSPRSVAFEDMLRNHVKNGEALVPAGKYFVLGDNRENSFDSRYWGFLDAADIVGKPILLYDSAAAATRWQRLFKLLS